MRSFALRRRSSALLAGGDGKAKDGRGRSKARASILIKHLEDPLLKVKRPVMDILKDSRVFTESTSEWYGSELLYCVQVHTRSPALNVNKIVEASSSAAGNRQVQPQRYLAIIRKTDPLTNTAMGVYFTQMIIRGVNGQGEDIVECKHPFELKTLKAVDNVMDEYSSSPLALADSTNGRESFSATTSSMKVIFVFPMGDVTLYFDNEDNVSECTLVLVHLVKFLYNQDVAVDFKLDLDSIGYSLVASGALYTSFPLLKSYGVGNSSSNSGIGGLDGFAEEELQADTLMEEYSWGKGSKGSTSSTENLLDTLGSESDNLQMEIIDFLLKWEDESGLDDKDQSSKKGDKSTVVTGKNNRPGSHSKLAPGKDTLDILQALHSVDLDLEAVDAWLSEQIDRLTPISSQLYTIESESGNLESSYENLTRVQKLLDGLIKLLELEEPDYDLLSSQSLQSIINKALNHSVLEELGSTLDPVTEAFERLHRACSASIYMQAKAGGAFVEDDSDAMNEKTGGDTSKNYAKLTEIALNSYPILADVDRVASSITSAQWQNLQLLSSVAMQREKLSELAEAACSTLAALSGTIFESLAKHKSWGGGSYSSGSGSMSTKGTPKGLVPHTGPYISVQKFDVHSLIESNIGTFGGTRSYTLGTRVDKNQALGAQRAYHGAVLEFLPLIEQVIGFGMASLTFGDQSNIGGAKGRDRTISISGNSVSRGVSQSAVSIRSAYVRSTRDNFYRPLIRTLFKDLSSMVASRQQARNLSTLKPYSLSVDLSGSKGGVASLESDDRGDQPLPKKSQAAASAGETKSKKDMQYYCLHRTTVDYQHPTLAPWDALEIALIVLSSVLDREEQFFDSIFNCAKGSMGRHKEIVSRIEPTRRRASFLFNSAGGTPSGPPSLSRTNSPNPNPNGIHGIHEQTVKNHHPLSEAQICLDEIFSEVKASIDRYILGVSGGDSTGKSQNSSSVDGLEAIALLFVLQNFMLRSNIPLQLPSWNDQEDAHTTTTANANNNKQNAYPLHMASTLHEVKDNLEARIVTFRTEQVQWLKVQSADPKAGALLPPMAHLPSLLQHIRLITDPAFAGTNSTSKEEEKQDLSTCSPASSCITELMQTLSQEVLGWTEKVALLNEKYSDVVRLINYTFFEESFAEQIVSMRNQVRTERRKQRKVMSDHLAIDTLMEGDESGGDDDDEDQQYDVSFAEGAVGVGGWESQASALCNALTPLVDQVAQLREDAETRYVRNMLAYKFPELASIAEKIENVGLGDRVRMEELALYVRRRDVLAVVQSMDKKSLENGISEMGSRMKRHLFSASDANRSTHLNTRTWQTLKTRMVESLSLLAEAATASYQISLLVSPEEASKMFSIVV